MMSNETQARAFIDQLEARANRQMVPYAHGQMCWRSFGSGQPLVLIHGGHGSWLHWVRNIEALASRYTVWVPDLPGYGDSTDLDNRGDFDALLHALSTTLDTLVGESTLIDIAGFSFGSVVATLLAVRRPGVRRLVLIGVPGHGSQRRQHTKLVNWRRSSDAASMDADLLQNLQGFMLHGPADALALNVHRYSCVHTRFRSKGISQSPILLESLDRFGGPTLILWGEHDVTCTPQYFGPQLAGGRANREWDIVPDAGHWLQYEDYDGVNQRLLDWFGR
ncbi:MAG TPA: alpha/beta fold hydrolase [Eoetvoesiella sp.]